MAPIFPPRSNTIARVSLVAVLILLAVIVGALVWWTHSPTFTRVGVAVPQPVERFSHALHVSGVGLNCRYCHDAVDQSSFAGLPPTETCMSCHSQIATDRPSLQMVRDSYANNVPIAWNRVNNVKDFVYFDHHIHVNKGVGCETCHGRMDQATTAVKAETFYMAWCLDCHRDPAKYVRPLEDIYTFGYQPTEDQAVVGARLVKEYNIASPFKLTNCSICHR